MLPVTVLDETGSLDAIVFSMVAEDLVEKNTYLTSQNMKVDALDHITALDTTIGKIRFSTLEQAQVQLLILLLCVEKSYNANPFESFISLQVPKVLDLV
jgi:hypothetical protein